MFSIRKNKPIANVVIGDYCLRVLISHENKMDLMHQPIEQMLPSGIIAGGKILDKAKLAAVIHELVLTWNLKGLDMRFYVPNALVIMRDMEIPKNVLDDEIKQYITMEIGNTIHFPFQNPLFDVYHVKETAENKKVTVFAAPEEEIMQYTELFRQAKLKPIQVDIQALGCYRYFVMKQQAPAESVPVYLFMELNLSFVTISIFHQHYIEFLRYQPLNIKTEHWKPTGRENTWQFQGDINLLDNEIDDQLNELTSIMNFYQFSIHEGTQTVTDLVLFGDMPNLQRIQHQLKERFRLPVHVLTPEDMFQDRLLPASFIPALGLVRKGRGK